MVFEKVGTEKTRDQVWGKVLVEIENYSWQKETLRNQTVSSTVGIQNQINRISDSFKNQISIRPPQELLPVLGLLELTAILP